VGSLREQRRREIPICSSPWGNGASVFITTLICLPSFTGVDHSLSVIAYFSSDSGLAISGYDSSRWPERDFNWEYRVPSDQIDQLREALGAKADEDTFEAFLSRFQNRSYGFWHWISAWFEEHGIRFIENKEWHDN
jgi:hypothetical protein